jgi:hypothetical protein
VDGTKKHRRFLCAANSPQSYISMIQMFPLIDGDSCLYWTGKRLLSPICRQGRKGVRCADSCNLGVASSSCFALAQAGPALKRVWREQH